MQVKLKIFFVLIGLIISHLYVGYIESERANKENFINEVGFNLILLGALDKNKTDRVKTLLASDINRIFLFAATDKHFKIDNKVCKIIDNNIKLLEKYDINISKKVLDIYPDIVDTRKHIIKGRGEITEYCKKRF